MKAIGAVLLVLAFAIAVACARWTMSVASAAARSSTLGSGVLGAAAVQAARQAADSKSKKASTPRKGVLNPAPP